MAGLTTHLIVSIVGFGIIFAIFKNWKYGIAFAIGHLIPDLISFGITGIREGSLNPTVIMTNSWFYPLAMFGHNIVHWIIIGTIIWIAVLLLYNFKKISQKNFITIIMILVCFLIGIGIHLVFDILIQEKSYWV
jgi:hypothetical protein